MVNPAADVLVIGAGVSGLTTAIRLAEAGYRVRVLAKDPPDCTTSAAAGASWGPYLLNDEQEKQWSRHTLDVLTELAGDTATGVRLVEGLEASDEEMEIPDWARGVEGFRPAGDLPEGYVVGWRYRLPLVDMQTYLGYLEERLQDKQIEVQWGTTVRRLDDVSDQAGVVVNCTGMGARSLVPDDTVTPVRGQLVVVRNPGVDWFFQDQREGKDMTYFLPHGDKVVLGGSALPDATAIEADPVIANGIVERCSRIVPEFRTAERIDNRVGFRPTREKVCLQRNGNVVHNYGHGGSGLTMSWGCAEAVLALVSEADVNGKYRDPSVV